MAPMRVAQPDDTALPRDDAALKGQQPASHRKRRLIGIITTTDCLRALLRLLDGQGGKPGGSGAPVDGSVAP